MINRSNVISNETSKQHVIEGYRFKVISEFTSEQEKAQNEQTHHEIPMPQAPIKEDKIEEPKEDKAEEQGVAFQPSFVEDLLKKTDKMSNNIIKLQMQIESQENEFNNRLASELENAKEKYTKEGFEEAKNEFEKELNALKDKYLKSISKLEEACANLDDFVIKNEKELADTAVDIAKEVILKELEEDSRKIAYALAKDLMEELKGASELELRVNAEDFEYLKEHFNQDSHIKVSLDDAISKGSVVILSNAGNIESNLNSRLNKIKKMIHND
ncbi:flagellar assembly protein FliH [Campylobacter upsaliensis]|nr:flagellar assembly protein FliH [Campylobacter upsaliensis]